MDHHWLVQNKYSGEEINDEIGKTNILVYVSNPRRICHCRHGLNKIKWSSLHVRISMYVLYTYTHLWLM